MYLSSISNQLEYHFLEVWSTHKSMLVFCALQGAKWHYGMPTLQKISLICKNLISIYTAFQPNPSHNDLLFTSQLLTGFDCLMPLRKLTWPDALDLCDYWKVTTALTHEQLVGACALTFLFPLNTLLLLDWFFSFNSGLCSYFWTFQPF